MLVVLVSAGSETTASLIATTIATLAQDPELQQHLRAHPEELPDALERILRADGPFQFHYRYVPADTELGGVHIPAQSRVLLMWAAANRPAPGDPALPVIDDERGPAPHFAFGRGLHFCIGAPVARLEARLAIERLLAATDHFELDPELPRRPTTEHLHPATRGAPAPGDAPAEFRHGPLTRYAWTGAGRSAAARLSSWESRNRREMDEVGAR